MNDTEVQLPWYRRIPKYGIVRVAVIQYIHKAPWIPAFLKPVLIAGAAQIPYSKNHGPEI